MLVADATGGSDTNLVVAALLHDAITRRYKLEKVSTELIAYELLCAEHSSSSRPILCGKYPPPCASTSLSPGYVSRIPS
jgi:hypothetical protein